MEAPITVQSLNEALRDELLPWVSFCDGMSVNEVFAAHGGAADKAFTGDRDAAAVAAIFALWTGHLGFCEISDALTAAQIFASQAIKCGKGEHYTLYTSVQSMLAKREYLLGRSDRACAIETGILEELDRAADQGISEAENILMSLQGLMNPDAWRNAAGDKRRGA